MASCLTVIAAGLGVVTAVAMAWGDGAAGRAAAQDAVARFTVVGDAIPQPLVEGTPDPGRGRNVVLDRRTGNCLICHRVPQTSERFQGDVGPDLAGVGLRLTPGQIRLRLVDQRRLNPSTLMPPYHRVADLRLVAEVYRGKPVLTASEIEDVVAYLSSLTAGPPG